MTMTLRAAAVLAACATLAACGQTPLERGATGALAGGAGARILGEDVGSGALIGGAVGAIGPCIANPNANGCF